MKEYLSLLPPHWVPVAGFTETLLQRFQGVREFLEAGCDFEATHSSGISN